MTSDFESYEEQVKFDTALAGLAIDPSGFGPDAQALEGALRERRLRFDGFRLVPVVQVGLDKRARQ